MKENNFNKILHKIFSQLNQFIGQYNQDGMNQNGLHLPKQEIKIVGQVALLLADLPFPVISTMDLDSVSQLPHVVQKELASLLIKEGLHWESDGHLIWMPKNTKYNLLFDFDHVSVLVADSNSVAASKYKFSRAKDKLLLETYLAHFPNLKTWFEEIKRGKKS